MKPIRFSILLAMAMGSVVVNGCAETRSASEPLRGPIPTRTAVDEGKTPAPAPATPAAAATPAPAPAPAPAPIPVAPPPVGALEPGILAFDAETKEVVAKPGEAEAHFTFGVTNVSAEEISISEIKTSCGCTVAKLPSNPWVLAPGTSGEFNVVMNIAGKPPGTTVKTVTVYCQKGSKTLLVKGTVPPPPVQAMDREGNQKLAQADRQAVFKGDCAKCHVEPTVGKVGHELYSKACGICHEAEHRATMVPNLHALTTPTNPEYWRNWIAHGKAGSLMPAFADSEGGPLNEAQITSLVEYLSATIPAKPTAQLNPGAPSVH